MRTLYLIRHATPAIQPTVPSPDWPLSERGIEETRRLSRTAKSWGLQALYASNEAKAQSTALVLGEELALPVGVVEGFQETRLDVWIGNSDEFGDAVRQILEQPELSWRGAERAATAAERFAAGVSIISEGPFPAAVVSHGRVITAWLAERLSIDDPFTLWRSIPMPGWASIDLDEAASGIAPVFHNEEH
jgi:broad specificity phosphatase PhoE